MKTNASNQKILKFLVLEWINEYKKRNMNKNYEHSIVYVLTLSSIFLTLSYCRGSIQPSLSIAMNLPKNPLIGASLLYFGIFEITIPIWIFTQLKKHLVSSNPFLAAVNSIFVQDLGYVWFTLAFTSHCFLFADANDTIPTPTVVLQLLKYFLNTVCWIVVNIWWFGPLLVERLNRATGGHCIAKDLQIVDLGMQRCRHSANNSWVDGFDLLGHYYFLLTLSLLLLHNRSNLPFVSGETRSQRIIDILMFVRALSAWLLMVWFLEFCVTSVFFHTVGERMAGLVGIPVVFGVLYVEKKIYPELEFCESEVEED